jgi:hypothetical protein
MLELLSYTWPIWALVGGASAWYFFTQGGW